MSNAIHTFLPWARRGLASQIQETENFGALTGPNERATIEANVHINVKINNVITPAGPSPLDMDLQIIGPGDVIGIHQDAIVRTEPHNWITNFEPLCFPFIDFYEEDFPWRYSPAKATTGVNATDGGHLTPWLSLVVLKENEFERVNEKGALLNVIALSDTLAASDRPLPKNTDLWAWAHVSIDDEIDGSTLDDKLTDLNEKVNEKPSIAISRIICPRKLDENTSYYAFLIPTYETGRLAGLGIETTTVKAQASAWDHTTSWSPRGANKLGNFPVYYEWYFRTGASGDFEHLVRQVKPRVLDPRVGQRQLDIQDPGYGLSYSGTQAAPGAVMLEGALRAPLNNAPVFPLGFPLNSPEDIFSKEMRDFINLGQDLQGTSITNPLYTTSYPSSNGSMLSDDPIVTPPLYGRWHALRNKVDLTNNPNLWLNELNLDPRYRVAASLGGDYVRKHQDLLMDEAWNQVGRVLENNRQAYRAQLSLETSNAMHAKHIESQPVEQIIPMTSSVHAKINMGTATLRQQSIESSLPDSASSNTFRKISRTNGSIMSRLHDNINLPVNNPVAKMIQGNLAPVSPKQAPGFMASKFSLDSLNDAIISIQSNTAPTSFNINIPLGSPVSANAFVTASFQSSFTPFDQVFDVVANWTPPAGPPNFTVTSNVVSGALNPNVTHVQRFYKGVGYVNQPPISVPDTIVPVMTSPSFRLPMYEALRELGTDYLIPNLNLLPQNSVTIVESNQKFIEAFLAGANYEMGRELLWREYPTDQRGTYFTYFWSGTDSEVSEPDITPVHTWVSNTQLGTHSGRSAVVADNLVLAIRGDFLRKFPNAVIYAVKAKFQDNDAGTGLDYVKARIEDDSVLPKFPIFSAKIDPDITFLGFDITDVDAKGDRDNGIPGWFFVIMERPGELRFGLDKPASAVVVKLSTWNDLTWNNVDVNEGGYLLLSTIPDFVLSPDADAKFFVPETTDTNWAEDSAAMAQILYQLPVKVLIHANEMI